MAEPLQSCKHCGAVVLAFTPNETELRAVVAALCNGSRTIAAAELQYFAQSTIAEATAWVDHLLACAYAWPNAEADEPVLEQIEQAFLTVPKPEHFTSYTHCAECAEHDETLRGRTRDTLRREDLGNGWDPIAFSSAEGIGYYFPALARFAMLPNAWRNDWYADQLLSHLAWEGRQNRFLEWCTPHQREAVVALLLRLSTPRTIAIGRSLPSDTLHEALAAWQCGPS